MLLCRISRRLFFSFFHSDIFSFFFNATATTEIYTLSLHDALPIYDATKFYVVNDGSTDWTYEYGAGGNSIENYAVLRSEEHTSELQSHSDLVCRLLLEKKKKKQKL